MPNLNKVLLMGNIVREPELRYTPGGTAVCDFTLAINHKWTDKDEQAREETTFAGVTAWDRKAEVVCEYCHKGDPLFVEGRLTQENWEDKETGKKREKTKVTLVAMEFLGGRKEESAQTAPPPAANTEQERYEIDDDIPF